MCSVGPHNTVKSFDTAAIFIRVFQLLGIKKLPTGRRYKNFVTNRDMTVLIDCWNGISGKR